MLLTAPLIGDAWWLVPSIDLRPGMRAYGADVVRDHSEIAIRQRLPARVKRSSERTCERMAITEPFTTKSQILSLTILVQRVVRSCRSLHATRNKTVPLVSLLFAMWCKWTAGLFVLRGKNFFLT